MQLYKSTFVRAADYAHLGTAMACTARWVTGKPGLSMVASMLPLLKQQINVSIMNAGIYVTKINSRQLASIFTCRDNRVCSTDAAGNTFLVFCAMCYVFACGLLKPKSVFLLFSWPIQVSDHPIFQNTGGPCDAVTSIHMQILVAYIGSFASPQAVVVGVQVTYSTTDVFSLVSDLMTLIFKWSEFLYSFEAPDAMTCQLCFHCEQLWHLSTSVSSKCSAQVHH